MFLTVYWNGSEPCDAPSMTASVTRSSLSMGRTRQLSSLRLIKKRRIERFSLFVF